MRPLHPFWRRAAAERPLDPQVLNDLNFPLIRPCEGDKAEKERVQAALERLSRRDQIIINAIFYERISKEDLAQRLKVTRHVLARLYREALAAFRTALEATK